MAMHSPVLRFRLRPMVLAVLIVFLTISIRAWGQGVPRMPVRDLSVGFPAILPATRVATVFVYIRPLTKASVLSAYINPSGAKLLQEFPKQLEPGETYRFQPTKIELRAGSLPSVDVKLRSLQPGSTYTKVALFAIALRELSLREQQGLRPTFTCKPKGRTQSCDTTYSLDSHANVQVLIKRSSDYADVRRLVPSPSDDGAREAGDQREPWDLRAQVGSRVQSGQYYSNLLVEFVDRVENQDTNDDSVSR